MSGLHFLKINDPDHINLRKALRTLLISPTIFFVADQFFDERFLGVFGFLSSFVALVFADFGGPVLRRPIPYLALAVVSTLSLVAGSLLADTIAPATLAMAAIMFVVVFGSAFSPYAPGFVAPVALAFAFAVFIPLSEIPLETRLIGWAIGSLSATLGAVILWPVSPRSDIRKGLQRCAEQLAEALRQRVNREAAAQALTDARASLTSARSRFDTPLRPAGAGQRDIALYALVDGMGHAADLVEQLLPIEVESQETALLDEVIAALDRMAKGLADNVADMDRLSQSIDRIDQCRLERLTDLVDETKRCLGDGPDADPLPTIRKAFPLMALSHLVLWIEADLACLTGHAQAVHAARSAPEISTSIGRSSNPYMRVRTLIRAHIDPDGVILRNAIRAGVAMGLGVLISKLTSFDHGFWVVLGVLSVLRSSASGTSVTALRAIAGTVGGFVISAAVLLALNGDTSGLWWAMLPMVFLAGYAPGAVGFAIGQAAFTTMVVFLFDILSPDGVTTAIVRLETVSLGAISAAAVALIIWPRGARAALAQAVSKVYHDAATGIREAVSRSQAGDDALAESLEASIRRATAAFSVALGERGEAVDAQAWTELLRPPAEVHALLMGLLRPFPSPPEGCGGAVNALNKQAEAIAGTMDGIGDHLVSQGRQSQPIDPSPLLDADEALKSCARANAESDTSDGIRDVLVMSSWESWLVRVQKALSQTQAAQVSVAGASAPGSWLHWSQKRGKIPGS